MGKKKSLAHYYAPTQAEYSLSYNNATYYDYLNRLTLLALSSFKWLNLPDTMNERWLEICLFYEGKALMFNDEIYGLINTKCVGQSGLNFYNEYTSYTAYGTNYPTKTIKANNCIYVRNNYLTSPTFLTIELYAKKLYEIDRTRDINIKAQKTPLLLCCDEDLRLTLKNLYNQYDGNEPVIFGSKTLGEQIESLIKCINTQAPFIADKLTQEKRNIWNECLTFLGLKNIDFEKKERMTEYESMINEEITDISSDVMLLCRQNAAKEFNKKYGTNIEVIRRTDYKGDGENGEIYNDVENPL